MLKYFPFGREADLKMGTLLLKENESLFEVDEHYLSEIKEKEKLLKEDFDYYFEGNETTEIYQWDVLELICKNLSKFYPEQFTLKIEGDSWIFDNKITQKIQQFVFGDCTTLPLAPLDWAGRQVQEDLVVLCNDGSHRLIAGQICFANGWSLRSKFDQNFLAIHGPTPLAVSPTINAAQKLMERITVDKSIWRMSWNMKIRNQLDFSSKYSEWYNDLLRQEASTFDENNIAKNVFIRIEKQTVTRLPRSGGLLFGLHTHQSSVFEECQDLERAKCVLGVLKTTPRELLDYKAVTPFKEVLLRYLEQKING